MYLFIFILLKYWNSTWNSTIVLYEAQSVFQSCYSDGIL